MKDNYREYNSIKLFRKKRRTAELIRLAETPQDYAYRRLLIEENEVDLHVYFSRKIVCNWVAWSFLGLSIYSLNQAIVECTLFSIAILLQSVSWIYDRKFKKTFRTYLFILSILNTLNSEERN